MAWSNSQGAAVDVPGTISGEYSAGILSRLTSVTHGFGEARK